MHKLSDEVLRTTHIHQMVKSTLKRCDQSLHGVGTFESVDIGRLARAGLSDFFDGAE